MPANYLHPNGCLLPRAVQLLLRHSGKACAEPAHHVEAAGDSREGFTPAQTNRDSTAWRAELVSGANGEMKSHNWCDPCFTATRKKRKAFYFDDAGVGYCAFCAKYYFPEKFDDALDVVKAAAQ